MHYNQPRVGGLSARPSPGTRIANVQLAGGSSICKCMTASRDTTVTRVAYGAARALARRVNLGAYGLYVSCSINLSGTINLRGPRVVSVRTDVC